MILCDDLQFIYHKMTYPFIWKKQGKKREYEKKSVN